MKKLFAIITSACIIAFSMTTAYAETFEAYRTEELNFRGYSWSGEISDHTPQKLLVTDTVVITQDTEIKDKQIRIEDNGILEITDGAEISLNRTQIFIENGGTLIVSDGELSVIANGSLSNVGTLIIGSNGKLNIKSGGFTTTSEGTFVCCGKISCVSEKHFDKAVSTIKYYDQNFNYADYAIYVYATGLYSATVQFKYCIDEIETNYKYTAKLSVKDGCRVTRSSIDLSKVYDKELRNELLDEVYAYDAVNDLPHDYGTGIKRQNYYLYSYSKNTLWNEYVYFILVFDTDTYFVYDVAETIRIR